MTARAVIEWQACMPIGERAVLVRVWPVVPPTRMVLGHVWPVRRGWCASDAAGRFLGRFRDQDRARRRVTVGQLLDGRPVLVRSKG